MPPQPPTSIGRYQIVRALGQGGMGSVYLAKDLEIDRFVAIKLLRSGLDESLRERFRREARAIGQLHHINIVMVFDVGEHEGNPFFAMEYIEGQTLQQIVRSGAAIPLANALLWIDGLCAGLAYAHRRGIVHRDIKPANLVVDDENRLKILDFGIARGAAPGMTQAGMLMGTPNYMAPEQIAGKPVDHRADTFAVGAVLYEVLTGKQVFPGDIRSGVLQKILVCQYPPVRQLVPSVPEDVAAIIERCLGREPEARYPDLETMRKDVAAAAGRAGQGDVTPATVIGRAVETPATPRTVTPDAATRAELLRQRRERIEQQMARARAALASRDLAGASDACTQALILDPELAEAFALQERIQQLQEAGRWLDDAKRELDRGAVTAATGLIDRASGVDPEMPAIAPLRDQVAAERRRREERARRLQEVLARGRAALEKDRLDAARAAVDEVRSAEPSHPDAAALQQAIEERVAAKRRAEAETARAKDAVARARQQFAAGEHQAAIATLTSHTPPHPVVDSARSALELKRRDILRRQEEERRLEAERRAEQERREAQKRADEERRQADAQRAEEQRRRQEEQRRAEAQRKREAEERRRAEETQRAEAERLAAEARARAEAERQREAEAAAIAAAPVAPASARDDISDEEETVVLSIAEVEELRADFPPATSETGAPAAADSNLEAKAEPVPPPVAQRAVSVPPAAGAGPPAATRTARLSPATLVRLAAAAVVVVAVIAWLVSRPDPPAGAAVPVAVFIDVRPWATVESILLKPEAQPVEVACPATPCIVNLPPGEYRIRASNPFFANPVEFDVSVGAGPFQEVRHALPDLDPEQEARRLLGGGGH